MALLPSPSLALHPYLPVRLGFRALLRKVNPEFSALLRATDPYTLVPARSRTTIYREARRVLREGVPGDFVEFGVHRGGTAAILAHLLLAEKHRHLHLFDCWNDLPEPSAEDGDKAVEYARAAIPEKLADLSEALPTTKHVIESIVKYPTDHVHYHQGWYSDTLANYNGNSIGFASIDCDYYDSVKMVLEFLGGRLSAGAILVLDDFTEWPGVEQALNEWLEGRSDVESVIPLRRCNSAIVRMK